jgi:hypothetical protein
MLVSIRSTRPSKDTSQVEKEPRLPGQYIDLIKNYLSRVAASRHEKFSLAAPKKEGAKPIGKTMLGFGGLCESEWIRSSWKCLVFLGYSLAPAGTTEAGNLGG